MIKALIFDLDGTLAETLESLTYSVSLTLKELGFPGITKEQCASFIGNGARVLMDKAIRASGGNSEELLDTAYHRYRQIFAQYCNYQVEPVKGIPELLEDLKRQGYKLGVFSNKPHPQTVDVVDQNFGEGYFDVVLGQREDIPRKPDPKGMQFCLDAMQVSVEECLYIGDSEVDVRAGEEARIRTIIVTWGFRTRKELLKAGAKPEDMINEPMELERYLDHE